MTNQTASILILFSLAAACAGSIPAHAQSNGRSDPGDPGIPTISDKPDSAFNGYQPFREQPVRAWKDANQEVADNPGMGSMANMPGMNMPGMDPKGGAAASDKPGSAMPGMGAMPGMNMPGMNSKGASATSGKTAKAMAGMGAMPAKGAMPKMNMGGAEAKDGHQEASKTEGAMPGMSAVGMASKDEHSSGARAGGSMPGMAMPGMGSKSDESDNAILMGTGVVRDVDKSTGRIRLTHDPIAAVSWPRLTIVFRMKNAALVDQVKQGDKVKFVLTRSSTGYVISEIQNVASNTTNQTK